MHGTLLSIGYRTKGAAERLAHAMNTHPNAILVDIRFSPRGLHGWNQAELQSQYGKRYLHIPELGNRNYRNPGHIEIVNLEKGVARLVDGLTKGYTIILLCACENYETCHRKHVVEAVQQAMK